jgi:hypothetical protein
MCIKLDKILELLMKEGIHVLDNDGVPLNEMETYEFVRQWKAKGYIYFSGECDHLDAEGKCLGHEILEEVESSTEAH